MCTKRSSLTVCLIRIHFLGHQQRRTQLQAIAAVIFLGLSLMLATAQSQLHYMSLLIIGLGSILSWKTQSAFVYSYAVAYSHGWLAGVAIDRNALIMPITLLSLLLSGSVAVWPALLALCVHLLSFNDEASTQLLLLGLSIFSAGTAASLWQTARFVYQHQRDGTKKSPPSLYSKLVPPQKQAPQRIALTSFPKSSLLLFKAQLKRPGVTANVIAIAIVFQLASLLLAAYALNSGDGFGLLIGSVASSAVFFCYISPVQSWQTAWLRTSPIPYQKIVALTFFIPLLVSFLFYCSAWLTAALLNAFDPLLFVFGGITLLAVLAWCTMVLAFAWRWRGTFANVMIAIIMSAPLFLIQLTGIFTLIFLPAIGYYLWKKGRTSWQMI